MSTLNPDGELMSLLDRVAARDEAALKTLYEHTSAKLFGLAMRILRHRDLAEAAWATARRLRAEAARRESEAPAPPTRSN